MRPRSDPSTTARLEPNQREDTRGDFATSLPNNQQQHGEQADESVAALLR